ncbi:serine-enriched protein-like [Lycorma delicatula]|uniref:serine-enriched protein-like n=1 Tax=Lycorma delicatula TaxID=130591 RepID=UPI003F510483
MLYQAPSPQRKKEPPPKENKLRLFLKRSSEPLLNLQNAAQQVLEFVDEHGNEVLNLGSFTLLPQHVVRLILAREELRADAFTKFQAALMWSKNYCDSNQNMVLKDVIGNFLEYIQFHKIPANVIMREVHPLGLVPYSIIMNVIK